MTVRAFKGKEGPCWERKQSVVYQGPWKQVLDDDGHVLCRGERMAVCDKTYQILTDEKGPYAESLIGIPPYQEIPLDSATKFNCKTKAVRHPQRDQRRKLSVHSSTGLTGLLQPWRMLLIS